LQVVEITKDKLAMTNDGTQTLYNARGAGDVLGLTSERARQLFKNGAIPTTARLNGRIALTDEATLRKVRARREEAKRRGR
jgi:hypothetical protein